MNAALGFIFQYLVIGVEPRAIAVHVHRAAGIGDINTLRAIALHQQRLFRKLFRFRHMAHHQKADRIHAKLARRANMLPGHIGLSAMGRHPHRTNAKLIGAL